MKKKSTLYSHSLTLIIFTVYLCYSSFAEARTWTSAADSTKTFEAEFKSLDGEFVHRAPHVISYLPDAAFQFVKLLGAVHSVRWWK